MTEKALSAELIEIIASMPVHPTSGELLGALVRAERAGYERARQDLIALEAARTPFQLPRASMLLRRQAE